MPSNVLLPVLQPADRPLRGEQVPVAFGTKVFGKIGDTNLRPRRQDAGRRELQPAGGEFPRRPRLAEHPGRKQGRPHLHGRQPDGGEEHARRVRLRLSDLAVPRARTSWPAAGLSTTGTTGPRVGTKASASRSIIRTISGISLPPTPIRRRAGPRRRFPATARRPDLQPERELPAASREGPRRPARPAVLLRGLAQPHWDLDGVLETRRLFTAPLNLRTEAASTSSSTSSPRRPAARGIGGRRRRRPAPGAYNFTNYSVEFESASHRPWAGASSGSSATSIPGTSTTSRSGSVSISRATPPSTWTPISSAAAFRRGTSPRTSTSSRPISSSPPGSG